MKKSLFRFKQFNVHQCDGVMNINTDGVLLAVHVACSPPKRILDIGTGTGVIALMLAQRFKSAVIDAIDRNVNAAKCAERNFSTSPFANRLCAYPTGFEQYVPEHPYDLIVMNPPFFINSLENADKEKTMARHTQLEFFSALFDKCSGWLTDAGSFQLIWPPALKDKCIDRGFLDQWMIQREVFVRSFNDSPVIRIITQIGQNKTANQHQDFIIYENKGVYSAFYRDLLQPFFLNF